MTSDNQPEQLPEPQEIEFKSLVELFEELTVKEYIQKVLDGIKAPKDSGDYKFAKLQILRLWAPVTAIVVPLMALLIVCIWPAKQFADIEYEVEVQEPEKLEKLDEIQEIPEKPPEPPDPQEITLEGPPSLVAGPPTEYQTTIPGPPVDFSPQPAPVDSVSIIRSPIVMKNVYGSRTPGARGELLRKGGGGNVTELGVLRALRWLKKYQEYDGSWLASAGGCQTPGGYARESTTANTSWALMAYLAHGETPMSEEFGVTVEKAIRWLVENQQDNGRFKIRDGNDYTLPIAAYGLCEAYGMTKLPMIKEAAKKSIKIIMNGQHASGGWNYNCNAENRDDTSYMAWCAQALKAADMAGVLDTEDHDKLKACLKKAIDGFKKNYNKNDDYSGHFGYTGPNAGHYGLTSAGTLCMQLLGAPRDSEVVGGLKYMENWKFDLANPGHGCPYYYWYYATQAKFQSGGDTWKSWNKMFAPELMKNQIVLRKAGIDKHDIGYWEASSKSEYVTSWVYNTTLCTLMLEVYYRYLPSFKPVDVEAMPVNPVVGEKKPVDNEIKIDVGMAK